MACMWSKFCIPDRDLEFIALVKDLRSLFSDLSACSENSWLSALRSEDNNRYAVIFKIARFDQRQAIYSVSNLRWEIQKR